MTKRGAPVMSNAFFVLFSLFWFLVGGALLLVNVFAFNDMPTNRAVLELTFLVSFCSWILLPFLVRMEFRSGRRGLFSLLVLLSWLFSTGVMFLVLSST